MGGDELYMRFGFVTSPTSRDVILHCVMMQSFPLGSLEERWILDEVFDMGICVYEFIDFHGLGGARSVEYSG